MKPKLKVWVLFGDRVKVGPGRAALLRLIDELGSMKQAVARFEMSYRYAWGYLRELEQAAGFRLVERQAGGSRTAGTRLTPQGHLYIKNHHLRMKSPSGKMNENIRNGFEERIAADFGIPPDVTARARGHLERLKRTWRVREGAGREEA